MTDTPTITRRSLFRYGAATGAAAGAAAAMPAAHAHGHGPPRVSPAPKPIPGGIPIPGGPLIHTFFPGPEDVTLPFTGLTLQGLDVEPSVISDYRGFTALAYHAGTATGSDGRRYDLETDIRAMEGAYVAEARRSRPPTRPPSVAGSPRPARRAGSPGPMSGSASAPTPGSAPTAATP
jgi:hypothetical protein